MEKRDESQVQESWGARPPPAACKPLCPESQGFQVSVFLQPRIDDDVVGNEEP